MRLGLPKRTASRPRGDLGETLGFKGPLTALLWPLETRPHHLLSGPKHEFPQPWASPKWPKAWLQGLQGLCRVSTALREDMLWMSTLLGPRRGRGQPSAGGTCEPSAPQPSAEEGVTGLRGAEGAARTLQEEF